LALPGRARSWFGTDAPRDAGEWGVARDAAATWLVRGTDRLMPVADLPVAGLHNAANALAALALADALGTAREPALAALRAFRGLAHRMTPVALVDGVAWYDDSKGTNVGATVAALAGMACPVVLIAGGDGKGQDFSPLCDPVRRKARAVILIGRDADRIAGAIAPSGIQPIRATDMDSAVAAAAEAARPGDAVLLSPACASYDMFRDYSHRAEVFVAAVKAREWLSAGGRGA
jgi:UDP-N-acetylmuramoylalanine--D-glutamate ligase